MTTVWMGCMHARRESSRSRGVTFLPSSDGAALGADGCSPRKRCGSSVEDIMSTTGERRYSGAGSGSLTHWGSAGDEELRAVRSGSEAGACPCSGRKEGRVEGGSGGGRRWEEAPVIFFRGAGGDGTREKKNIL